jgi:hypothetical protein
MSLERRKCLTWHEDLKPLISEGLVQNMTVFKNYSAASCLLECRARDIFNSCHCLPYYFPAFDLAWNTSTTCNFTNLQCLTSESSISYSEL